MGRLYHESAQIFTNCVLVNKMWDMRLNSFPPLSTLRTQRNSIHLRVLLDDKDRRVSMSLFPLLLFPPGRGIFVGGVEGGCAALHTPIFFAPFSPAGGGEGGWGDERVSAY